MSEPTLIIPNNRWETSNIYYRQNHLTADGNPNLWWYESEWWVYDENYWRTTSQQVFRQNMYSWLGDCRKPTNNGETTRVDPNPRMVNDMIDAVKAISTFPENQHQPCWFLAEDGEEEPCSPNNVVAFKNTIVEITGDKEKVKMHEHDGRWFSPTVLSFDYSRESKCPIWDEFIDDCLGGDKKSIKAIHEWWGYCLTGDLSYQKFAIIVGPPGSGKSTACKVMSCVIGERNVCTPTLNSIGSPFGLWPLMGKSVAMVTDAHLERGSAASVLERLKMITGTDPVMIERKYLPPVTNTVLPTRFIITCNEIPSFYDTSAALARRVLSFSFPNSVVGKEDFGLFEKLTKEAPGIINRCIEGLHRLRERGMFTQPVQGKEIIKLLTVDAGSMQGFINHWIEMSDDDQDGSPYTIAVDDMYLAFSRWLDKCGNKRVNRDTFLKRLYTIHPTHCQSRKWLKLGDRRIEIMTGLRLKHTFYFECGGSDGFVLITQKGGTQLLASRGVSLNTMLEEPGDSMNIDGIPF